MELATRSARRKNLDIEDVLIDEFQVKPPAIGEALSQFFKVPYESFKQDRVKPLDLLKNLKRDYVESSLWVPIEDVKEGLIVLTTDPEKVRASKVVSNIFPKHKVVYKVCTHREFAATLDQLFGAESGDASSIGELLSTMDEENDEEGGSSSADDASLAQDNELVKLVNKIIVDAYHQGASDIHIEPYPGKGKTEVRFRKDGTLQNYISVPASYRNAIAARLKVMCDLDISEKRKPQDGKIKFKKFGPPRHRTAGGHDSIGGRRRGYRHAYSGRGRTDPDRQARSVPAQCGHPEGNGQQALRAVLRVRPDRFRQDHYIALGARLPEYAGNQDLDGRRSGGNHAEGPAPGADEPERPGSPSRWP